VTLVGPELSLSLPRSMRDSVERETKVVGRLLAGRRFPVAGKEVTIVSE
jgi:hypothetical protein